MRRFAPLLLALLAAPAAADDSNALRRLSEARGALVDRNLDPSERGLRSLELTFEALDAGPESAQAKAMIENHLGFLYWRGERFQTAVRHYERSLAIQEAADEQLRLTTDFRRRRATTLYCLGQILEIELEQPEEAHQRYLAAHQADPTWMTALALSRWHYRRGRNPDDQQKQELLQHLEEAWAYAREADSRRDQQRLGANHEVCKLQLATVLLAMNHPEGGAALKEADRSSYLRLNRSDSRGPANLPKLVRIRYLRALLAAQRDDRQSAERYLSHLFANTSSTSWRNRLRKMIRTEPDLRWLFDPDRKVESGQVFLALDPQGRELEHHRVLVHTPFDYRRSRRKRSGLTLYARTRRGESAPVLSVSHVGLGSLSVSDALARLGQLFPEAKISREKTENGETLRIEQTVTQQGVTLRERGYARVHGKHVYLFFLANVPAERFEEHAPTLDRVWETATFRTKQDVEPADETEDDADHQPPPDVLRALERLPDLSRLFDEKPAKDSAPKPSVPEKTSDGGAPTNVPTETTRTVPVDLPPPATAPEEEDSNFAVGVLVGLLAFVGLLVAFKVSGGSSSGQEGS